ncbi:FecR domain-containing protein [Dyadobacter sp. 676]|uniref:FecR domain-containing protein n=1 Tax=Dyadobacter sp. 676 TaxID=3088362 RepID=A0AAU8FNG4_9BACT
METFDGKKDFLRMVRRYLRGYASKKEKTFLDELYDRQENRDDILDQYSGEDRAALGGEMERNILRRIAGDHDDAGLRLGFPWSRLIAAASVVLLVMAGAAYYLKRSAMPPKPIAVPTDFSPGSDRAVLTLADGSTILLDSAGKGQIASQGNAVITKNRDGELAYKVTGTAMAAVGMNTIDTPAGGQYSIVLPDGSRVWLNAKSSITFPNVFTGNERRVSIKGECYFEIQKERNKPFVVDVDGRQKVVVTGTHFNVSAYADEPEIRTTLLEGAVSVSHGAEESLHLMPGEQAASGEGGLRKRTVDADEAVAWKNGFFQFRETSLAAIMRDIGRWYNVEVDYPQGIPEKRFSGKLRRNTNASAILEILKFAGVNFRMESSASQAFKGKIVVLPTEKGL